MQASVVWRICDPSLCLALRKRQHAGGPELFKVTWTWGEGPEGRQKHDVKHWGVTHQEGRTAGVAEFKEEKAEMGTQSSWRVEQAGSRGEGEGFW